MTAVIPLKNTAMFYDFLKKKSNEFDDFEFVTQAQYFDELLARDSVERRELQELFDAQIFWRLWLTNTKVLKMYTAMLIELSCYMLLMDEYGITVKIEGER